MPDDKSALHAQEEVMPDDRLRIKHMQHVHVEGADITDTLFSHEHPDIQTVNITRLLKAIKENKIPSGLLNLNFAEESVNRIESERDIDPKIIAFLEANPAKQNEPLLGVLLGDGTVVIIDGSHRSALWGRRKVYTMPVSLIHISSVPEFRVRTFIDGKEATIDRDKLMASYEFNKPKR